MGVPKQRTSRTRQGNRRRHQFIAAPQLVTCTNCRAIRMSHHVCPSCGQYRGRQVIDVQERPRASTNQ